MGANSVTKNIIEFPKLRGEGNRKVTQGLFLEHGDFDRSYFTTSNQDRTVTHEDGRTKTFYSFRRLYVECLDPTDIKFIDAYMQGDFEHFQTVIKNRSIGLDMESMREEVALRLQSIALEKILKSAPSSSKDALQAAKYLGSRNWEQAKKPKPVKKQEQTSSDYERVKDLLK